MTTWRVPAAARRLGQGARISPTRTIGLVSAGTAAAVLLVGSVAAVLGAEEAVDEGPLYLYGEVEGYLHPDLENPFGCEVG